MPSAWVERYETPSGGRRFRARYTLGGKGARRRHGGSFGRKADANVRVAWLLGELAAMRVPNLSVLAENASSVSILADRWLATRIDLAESTSTRHGLELARIKRVLGSRPADELTPDEIAGFVVGLGENYSRGTIRKTLQTLAMILDHASIDPNPARDKRVRLPREEAEDINPPSAEHVEAVFELLPAKHRLAFLFLDWSGARVSAIDALLVSDYDAKRQRVRLRAATTKTRKALWIELHPVLAQAIEATLEPERSAGGLRLVGEREAEARLFPDSGADALRTSIATASRAAGVPLFSPHDLRHRRISLLHAQGKSWATIGAFVGQRSLSVTADTYTHVLTDEAEVEYAELLR